VVGWYVHRPLSEYLFLPWKNFTKTQLSLSSIAGNIDCMSQKLFPIAFRPKKCFSPPCKYFNFRIRQNVCSMYTQCWKKVRMECCRLAIFLPSFSVKIKLTLPYSLAGFDLTTHSSSLLGGKRKLTLTLTLPASFPVFVCVHFNLALILLTNKLTRKIARWQHSACSSSLNFVNFYWIGSFVVFFNWCALQPTSPLHRKPTYLLQQPGTIKKGSYWLTLCI
jgi:hypothetical protein